MIKKLPNIDVIIEEAIVDSDGPYEQVWGFQVMLDDSGICPFVAEIVGKQIKIISIDVDNDRLVGIYKLGNKKGKVDLLDLNIPTSIKGYEYIVAYKKWRKDQT